MAEVALFFAVAVVAYLAADRGLDLVERRIGRRLEHRSILFFALLLGFLLAGFAIAEALFPR